MLHACYRLIHDQNCRRDVRNASLLVWLLMSVVVRVCAPERCYGCVRAGTPPVHQEKSFRDKYLQQLLVPQNPTNKNKCFPRISPTISIIRIRRKNASPAIRLPPAAHPTDCLCRRILPITQAKSQPRKTDVSSVVEKREEFLRERLWIEYEHKIQPQTQTESHTY